jgi:excisionase family DNA binding protein
MRPVYAPDALGGLILGPVAYTFEVEAPGVTEQKALLSVAEAAKVLGMSRTLVNEMTNDGTLPYITVRGRKKIRRDDVRAFVKYGSRKRRKAA